MSEVYEFQLENDTMPTERFVSLFTNQFRSSLLTPKIFNLLKQKFDNKRYFDICFMKCTSYDNFIMRMESMEIISKNTRPVFHKVTNCNNNSESCENEVNCRWRPAF